MPTPTTWFDLAADPRMTATLDAADAGGTRAAALNTSGEKGTQLKKNWSNRFADTCARMVADCIRDQKAFGSHLLVRPSGSGPAEPMTFQAGGKSKKLDVAVSSHLSGLLLGVSLKGLNFRDSGGSNYDKNLTGRTYELRDEMRVIHGHQPAAFMAALYLLPLASTIDKPNRSSFAHTVEHLRGLTGRLDPMLPSQLDRVDYAAVGLYVPGDTEVVKGQVEYADTLPRGVVRYFDVMDDPPERGRPRLSTTHTLDELVSRLLGAYHEFSGAPAIDWADPE